MKHIPLILAILTAAFLTFCFVVEEPTIWVTYDGPDSWWQSFLLGSIGFWLMMPTFFVMDLIIYLAGLPRDFGPSPFIMNVIQYSPIITVALIAMVVFYTTRTLLRFIKPNTALEPTATVPSVSDKP